MLVKKAIASINLKIIMLENIKLKIIFSKFQSKLGSGGEHFLVRNRS